MPKVINTIQFSLSREYLDKLTDRAQKGESLGVCAKRLLIELLDSGEQLPSDRLDRLEEQVLEITGKNIYETIGNLEERIKALEANQKGDTSELERDRDNLLIRLGEQEKRIYDEANELNRKLEARNYQLEKAIDETERENQWLNQKLNLQPGFTEPLPPSEHEGKGINTSALAALLNVDRSTISRWKTKGDPRLGDWIQGDDGKWISSSK